MVIHSVKYLKDKDANVCDGNNYAVNYEYIKSIC